MLTPDRVFVKAITIIRALSSRSRTGLLKRPPAENRIKLYGLYKQATEGDVSGIMPRPEGNTLEDEGAKQKYDAWKREEGLSKTEAKRAYVLYLIETLRVYAGTPEARELLSELEYIWDQVKDLDYTDADLESNFPYQSIRLGMGHSMGPGSGHGLGPGLEALVVSYMSQSDRFSTDTPWPLQSSYSALVYQPQPKSNIEQIYLHLRRNNQHHLEEPLKRSPNAAGSLSTHPSQGVDDFRAWQGQINSIVNKLSREFSQQKHRPLSRNPYFRESDSDHELDPTEITKRKILSILKIVGRNSFNVLKNFVFSVLALLFVVWCLNKNVVVKRTIIRKQLDSMKFLEELVINMVINTKENKWFVRLLSILNSFVGFV